MSKGPRLGQTVKLDVQGVTPVQSVTGSLVALGPPLVLALDKGKPPPALVPGAPVMVGYNVGELFTKGRSAVVNVISGRPTSVVFEPLRELQTSQRRQFFRVPASLLALLVVSSRRAADLGLNDPRAITQDVSAGGMRVDTVLPLESGDRVRVTVDTPRGLLGALPEKMIGEAAVVHVGQAMRAGRKVCSAGLQFTFTTDSEQQRWQKLTFDLQRVLIAK